jgi:hypothetical protein
VSNNKKNKKKEEQYKTLLSVLANGSWDSARDLLKKHSGQDATDPKDLEVKLARVYALSPRKYEIEKEFASIHPHKDFILKYNTPKIEEAPKSPLAEVKPTFEAEVPNKVEDDKIVVSQKIVHEGWASAEGHAPCGNPNCPKCARYFASSNCEGNPTCACNKTSNACGCSSSFNGSSNADGQSMAQPQKDNTQGLMVIGIVSIVAVVGMVLYLKSKNN